MGKATFDPGWLQQSDGAGMLYKDYIVVQQDKLALGEVYCSICNRKKISFGNRGITALKDHADSNRHQKLAAISNSSNQLRIALVPQESAPASSSSVEAGPSKELTQPKIQLLLPESNMLAKEVMWTIHIVMKNESFRSAEKDGKTLRLLGPQDLKGFSLNRQKMADLVNYAIGPFFRELFLNDVRKEYFSILFDETDANNKTKELEIICKYYSVRLGKLIFFHLESVFLGKATADILLDKITTSLQKAQLPSDKLVMVSRDGPRVNQSLIRKYNNSLIAERGFGLVETGSCPAHIIHNSVKYALKEYGCEVSELAKIVYYYYDVPARWEEFLKNSTQKKPKKFVRFVETRWVMLGKAAQQLLDSFEDLTNVKNKLQRIDSKKLTFHENALVRLMSIEGIKSMIRFVLEVCSSAEAMIMYLETNEFILFDVFEREKEFIIKWLSKVYDADQIHQALEDRQLRDNHYLQASEVQLPSAVTQEKVSERIRSEIKTGGQKHIVKLVSYLFANKFPHDFFKLVSCFKPKNLFKFGSEVSFQQLADHVGFGLDRVLVHEEVVTLKNVESYSEEESDVAFYDRVFAQHKFVELKKLYKIVITVSHSNAESERRFNLSNEILTENRANMSEELFNQRKNIVNGMLFYSNDIEQFVPPKELLLKAKMARQAHNEKIEAEKQAEKQRQLEKKEKEKERSEKKKVLEAQEKVVKKKRQAADELSNIMTEQVKKLKGDQPEIACLKIMAVQRDKLLAEEAKEGEELEKLRNL